MIYDCICDKCGEKQEIVRKVADRNDTPLCCGKKMRRLITSNYFVNPDYNFWTSDITGDPVHITSKQQHKKLCKENHVAPLGRKGEF